MSTTGNLIEERRDRGSIRCYVLRGEFGRPPVVIGRGICIIIGIVGFSVNGRANDGIVYNGVRRRRGAASKHHRGSAPKGNSLHVFSFCDERARKELRSLCRRSTNTIRSPHLWTSSGNANSLIQKISSRPCLELNQRGQRERGVQGSRSMY